MKPPTIADAKTPRKRRRKPGDLAALKRVLWRAITEAEALLERGDAATKLKTVYALATAAGSYVRVIEAHDLERRIEALEDERGAAGVLPIKPLSPVESSQPEALEPEEEDDLE